MGIVVCDTFNFNSYIDFFIRVLRISNISLPYVFLDEVSKTNKYIFTLSGIPLLMLN